MTDFVQGYPDGVILAFDEMKLYFQATLTHVWAAIGQTPLVAVQPQREQSSFYGVLNLRNGREIAMGSTQQNSEHTANFLMQVLMIYPQPILLLMDRAPWHFGAVTALLEATDRLELLYFPVACPELNPQEHIWAQARDNISHNHTYRSFETLLDDFETYLNETLFETHFMQKYTPSSLWLT